MKKLLTVGFALVSAAALATDYTAWNNADMALGDGDTLTISANTTVTAGKLTGTGKVTINSGVTLTDSTLFGEGFTGTMEVNGGTFEFRGNGDQTHPYTAAAQITLSNGGKLRETSNGVNLYMTNNVAIVGSGNEIYSSEANVYLQGNLLGSGSVLLNTYKRGVRLYGDNSGFSGTVEMKVLENEGKWQANGIWTATAGSTNATWNFTTASAFTQGGFTYSYVIYYAKDSANPLRLGALNLTNPKTVISTCGNAGQDSYRDRSHIVIGEKNEDCAIEGGFCRAPITFTKAGTAKLTLGTGFDCPGGSVMNATNGVLVVNSDTTNLVINVKAGATLTGSGTAYVGSIEEGASITGNVDVVFMQRTDLVYQRSAIPFKDNYTGSVIFTNGALVVWSGTAWEDTEKSGDNMKQNISPFGTAKLVFAGGTLEGFNHTNNQYLHNAIEVVGDDNKLDNKHDAGNGSSVNLLLDGGISGSGSLTINNNGRWLKFEGDNAEFSGSLTITGQSSIDQTGGDDANATYFQEASAGSAAASWTHDRKSWLKLQHAADSTIRFGALNITANTTKTYVENAGTTVEIGGNNDDSAINNPFLGKAFKLKKVGYGSLTFADTVTFQSGMTFEVAPSTDGVVGPGVPSDLSTEYALLTLPSGSTATVTQPTTGNGWSSASGKSKWVVQSAASDGAATYKLVWVPCRGFTIILR